MPRKRRTPLPTLDDVRTVFSYDPETGKFVFAKRAGNQPAGKEAGAIDCAGYRRLKINGRPYAAHHIAWLICHGQYPDREVQHINGARDDNRICNLRLNHDERDDLTLELIQRHVSYDANTGEFTWNVRKGRHAKPGLKAGSKDKSEGYVIISIAGHRLRGHRLAWFYTHGEWPIGEVDHINGVRDDNRMSNLRVVDDLQGAWNAGVRIDSASGIRGVSFHDRSQKWMAYINVAGKRIHIGYFASIKDAAEARRLYEAKHYGEYTRQAA